MNAFTHLALFCLLGIGGYVMSETCKQFLDDYNTNVGVYAYNSSQAAWMKATNITAYNSAVYANESKKYTQIMKDYRARAKACDQSAASDDEKRQLKLLLTTMTSSDADVVDQVINIATTMENIYSEGCIPYDAAIIKTIKVPAGVTCLTLDNYLNPIMAQSRDPKELLYVWENWRKVTGPKLKDHYKDYVRLNNIGARENGFADAGDYKRKRYEVDDLKESAEAFWNELRDFYQEVHAYVRHRLADRYPAQVDQKGAIPAHLLGNMWAQGWENVFDIVSPFSHLPKLDITPTLQKKHNVTTMFETAEEFFTSIGWQKLPKQFWNKSMLVKPPNLNVTCHASAWDFSIKQKGEEDVRVKMCTKIDQDDFITIHHELGHIYYDLLYWDLPNQYRDGANPGFHEAVGDVLALSVQTPNHLKKLGLLDDVSTTPESEINFLLKTALERVAFLPFGYLMDQWMWNVYSGEIPFEEYNKKWWAMRLKYQGLKPPVARDESNFDPGAKYHIPADTPYIRYFFSHILQFSFHKAACDKANYTGPLHKCSIYESKEAGKLLSDMLSLGKSKPWPEALRVGTGSSQLTAAPINEYFKPLQDWLVKQRKELKYAKGWDVPTDDSSFANNVRSNFVIVLASSVFALFVYLGF